MRLLRPAVGTEDADPQRLARGNTVARLAGRSAFTSVAHGSAFPRLAT
jgi:hypothetical protein